MHKTACVRIYIIAFRTNELREENEEKKKQSKKL